MNNNINCCLRLKKVILFFLLSFIALIPNTWADEPAAEAFPFLSGETLHYKLSYRGLLTSMIWADLADVKMTYLTGKKTPEQKNAYQYELFLTTEHYSKAELFQPVRYTYTTTLDSTLQRVVLIEEVDNGRNQSHDFLWLDWENKATELFKKREKKKQSNGFLGLDITEVWEKDGKLSIPAFFGDFPLLADQKTYLIHKESGDKIEHSEILDPLSLIYSLRSIDFDTETKHQNIRQISVAVSDDIRLYYVEKLSLEKISINGQSVQGTKYKIQTDEKKDNFYYVWLSDDEKKIPLRMAMDAPLGKIEIDLMKVTQGE
ncbi:MAG: DUF3108 domain-containing protein [Gammaproteobacteria bacterium]|nr:DUF3108 domain-containing protein [Gammaproteobacteria bacterium]